MLNKNFSVAKIVLYLQIQFEIIFMRQNLITYQIRDKES